MSVMGDGSLSCLFLVCLFALVVCQDFATEEQWTWMTEDADTFVLMSSLDVGYW